MLDFYLSDPTAKEKNPNREQASLGGLTLEEWEWMVRIGILDPEQISFFKDATLGIQEIEEILGKIDAYIKASDDVPGFQSPALKRFETMLRRASNNNVGIKVVCD